MRDSGTVLQIGSRAAADPRPHRQPPV